MPFSLTTDDYDRCRISPVWPQVWYHGTLVKGLKDFAERFPSKLSLTQVGESVENRSVFEVRIGSGPKRVLLWSQMHGDEPTHTTVLMDVLNFLLTEPEHPAARALLTNCTLVMLPMLNPDGAEMNSRRNAQQVDVNRDARYLQAPEGRILNEAVKRVKPQFAFNLHNHNPRASSSKDPQPAAVALLAPPVDEENTERPNVKQAKKLVMTFVDAIEPYVGNMVSRYNADYMARAFGEAIQNSGAATVLVEAGGWKDVDAAPLAGVHFVGMMNTLLAIADDSFEKADSARYDKLPLSGLREIYDLMVQGVELVNGVGQQPFRADLGINFDKAVFQGKTRGSSIVDLGDLRITSGKQVLDAEGMRCFPGRLAFCPGITATHLPTRKEVEELLAGGATTILGSVDLASGDEVRAFTQLKDSTPLALHLGFVGDGAQLKGGTPEVVDQLLLAIAHGVLGLIEEGLPESLKKYAEWFGVPVLARKELQELSAERKWTVATADQNGDLARKLSIAGQGTLRLGSGANLVLFKEGSTPQQVLVDGNLAWVEGKLETLDAGRVLRRRR